MDHAASAPNAGLASLYGTDMVEIIVGPNAERYLIHKKPLCDTALYFDKMFNGDFKEADVQKCSEPEADPVAFNLFIHVVYAGEFPEDIRDGKHDGEALVKFYILGNKYLAEKPLMDMALEAIRKMRPHADLTPTLSQRAARAALMSLDTSDTMFKRVMNIVCLDYIVDIVDDEWLDQVVEGVPPGAAIQVTYLRVMRTCDENRFRMDFLGPPRGTKRKATASAPKSDDDEEPKDDL